MKGRFAIVAGAKREGIVRRLTATGLERIAIADVDVFADAHLNRFLNLRGPAMVMGALFRRSDFAPIRTLDTGLAHAIAASGGRYLIDHFWGGYVALAGEHGQYGTAVVRDPSAHVPLYRWALDGCDLYFNDFTLACSVSGQSPALDWTAIAHRLRFPALRIAETGLAAISEVIPGSRVSLDTGETDLLWKPWDFADAVSIKSDPAQLAETIDACTRSWTSLSDRINLELSGGLDSSIVAASVAATGRDWRCVTYATDAAAGDERTYARAVATHFGASLDEHVISADALDAIAAPRLRVRPGGFGVLSEIDHLLAAHAHPADVLFSGGGGDNIFCKTRAASPIVDALLLSGPRAAWSATHDLADLCETSLWDALRHGGRQWLRRRRAWSWPKTDALLTHSALVPCRGHPWLDEGAKSWPGKRAHIAGLLGVLPFVDGYDRSFDFPLIYPLLSQPVVEHCLAVPSWRWIAGGRDRAYARDAFAARLPEIIIRRRSKGGLRSIMIPAFERARGALTHLLCNGRLADQGLIDRSATRAVLESPLPQGSEDYVRVFELADMELWVRSIERLRRVHR